MNTSKKPKYKKNKFRILMILLVLICLLFLLVVFAFKNDLINITNSNAQAKKYNRIYPAGDIVEKKPIKVLNYDDAEAKNNNEDPYDYSIPKINWRSVGKKISISTNSKNRKINGWRTRSSPNFPRMTYISKSFIIPKPENLRNRPMAVQLCWKAKSYNSNVNIRLYRQGARSWYSTSNTSYDHRKESNKTARRLGCFGFNEYIYDTNDYATPVNRQVRARMYVAVMGDPIDIAAIKVKSIHLPTGDYRSMRADFNSGKLFGDGTNLSK